MFNCKDEVNALYSSIDYLTSYDICSKNKTELQMFVSKRHVLFQTSFWWCTYILVCLLIAYKYFWSLLAWVIVNIET